MLACVDLSGQALDCLDVVEAESGHFLAGLLHLFYARGEVAQFALFAQNFISV